METFVPRNVPRSPEFKYGKQRLDQYLKIHANRVPNKVCINYYGKEITWKEVDDYVNRLATLLTKLGVKKGEPVALFMQNCPQFLISFYAIQRIGAIVGPCSPMFKEWELEYEINELKARVIIANSYLYPIIKNTKQSTTLEHVIITPFSDFLPEEMALPFDFEVEEPSDYNGAMLLMEELKKIQPDVPEINVNIKDDISLIIFTSGTTGLPKGALITFDNALYKAVSTATAYYSNEYDVYLSTQPIYHIAGMCMMNGHIYNGSTMVLITKYSPEVVMMAIDKFKCNTWYGSAPMNADIVNHPDVGKYNLCSMRINTCTSFGIQLTEDLAKQWSEVTRGGLLLEAAYGLSESHTMDTVTPPEKPKYGTCGIPMFEEMYVRILDDDGSECSVGVTGEIVVKNPGVFKGYLNNPEATAQVLRDGWLYTGDIGKLDEEGNLIFLGRKKEMMKSSGYSVFPEEVELFLCRHEAVQKAAVIGKLDSRRGELIKAFVVLNEKYKGKISEEELIEWSKDKMATYKRPREIEFRDTLPATGTGKLLRRVLKEEEEKKTEKEGC